jgi:hypothetical protein
MRTAAFVLLGLGWASLAAMVVLFGVGVWTGDGRFGLLGLLSAFFGFIAMFGGAFCANQAGMGVKK